MKPKHITTISIEMPWILRWAKRFVRLEIKQRDLPKIIKGKSCGCITFITFDEFEMVNK